MDSQPFLDKAILLLKEQLHSLGVLLRPGIVSRFTGHTGVQECFCNTLHSDPCLSYMLLSLMQFSVRSLITTDTDHLQCTPFCQLWEKAYILVGEDLELGTQVADLILCVLICKQSLE